MAANPTQRRAAFLLILAVISVLHGVLLTLRPIHRRDIRQSKIVPLRVRVLSEERVAGQIVRSIDSEKREAKEDAFLSDKTRSFDRQSKSQKSEPFQAGGGSRDLSFSELADGLGQNPFQATARAYGRRKARSMASNDYLKEIPAEGSTKLNTVEFKYYGFYLRIRQKLEQFWGRSLHETAARFAVSGRQVSLSSDHITALRVTLNASGEVIEIEVIGASGVTELDEAAVESFNEAGPFPNPPKGLVVDGKVTLVWGFVVQS